MTRGAVRVQAGCMVSLRNSTESYGIIAQAFHWLVALLVLAQLGLGLYAANLPVGLARLRCLADHNSPGLASLARVLLVLGGRACQPPPRAQCPATGRARAAAA